MKASPNIRKVISMLNGDLSIADRSLLISAILKPLGAIPLRDIIMTNEKGNLFVNDRKVDIEEANALRTSAMRVLNERSFKLIREQVVYTTFVQAAHKAALPEELMFGKAALWWGQEEDRMFKLLSAEDRNGNSSPLGD